MLQKNNAYVFRNVFPVINVKKKLNARFKYNASADIFHAKIYIWRIFLEVEAEFLQN